MMFNSLKASLLVWMLVLFSNTSVHAASLNLTQIHIIKFPEFTRAVFNVEGKTPVDVFTLSHPNRVVFDFKKTFLNVNIKQLPLKNTEITQVRTGYSKNSTLRVVFDMDSAVSIKRYVISDTTINSSELVVDIYPAQQQKTVAVLTPLKKPHTTLEIVNETVPRHEFGFNVNEAYVSDLASYWNYSSVYYYRLTDAGKFGGHVNYANRYGTTAEQFQLEAYPKFSKNAYATLSVSYANTMQILFPSYQYYLEGYLDVAKGFEFSLGQGGKRFVRFSNQKIFDYTGTVGKYVGNSFLWFRPHHFTPKNTEFYEIGLRKYFDDPNNYIALVISAGKLPDIGDVPPLDQMIVIHQKGLNVGGQLSLTKTLFLKYGMGYTKQLFPTLTREITDGSLGLTWKI